MTLPSEVARSLDAATEWVEFSDQQSLARAVGTLIACHRHTFVVATGKDTWSVCISEIAMKCLQTHLTGMRLESIED